MKLMKYQRGYLGDADEELDFRSSSRCGGTSAIEAATFSATVGDVVEVAAGSATKIWVEALDDTLAILFYYATSVGVKAVLLSRSGLVPAVLDTQTIATPASTSQNIMAVKLTSTKVLVSYTSGTGPAYAIVVDVVGGATLSAGSSYQTVASGPIDSHPRLTAMSSSRAVLAYSVGSLFFLVLDVSGTVVTVGSPTASSTTRGHVDVVALTSSKFLATYEAFPNLLARVGNISGATATLATESGTLATYGTASASARTSVKKLSSASGWLSWGGGNVVKSVTISVDGSDVPSIGSINTTTDSTATNLNNCFNTALLQANKSAVATLNQSTAYPVVYGYRLSGGVATRDTSNQLEAAAGKEISISGMSSSVSMLARTRSSDDRLVVQVIDVSVAT